MSSFPRPLSAIVALGLAACASSGDPEPMAAPAPTTAAAPAAAVGSGVAFSALQVNRGQNTFNSVCSACHAAGEFSDPAFKTQWSRRSVGDLYEFILTMMPDDAPGILTPEQAAELTAFMLDMNGYEAGSSMMDADQAALDEISLEGLGSE